MDPEETADFDPWGFCPSFENPEPKVEEEGTPEEVLEMVERVYPPIVECPVPTVPLVEEELETFRFTGSAENRLDLVRAFFQSGSYSLGNILENKFKGAGLYGISYSGLAEMYAAVRYPDINIYAGSSSSEGVMGGEEKGRAPSVWERLANHFASIRQVKSGVLINPGEFTFRIVLLPEEEAKAAEGFLIKRLRPVWCHSGFGNRSYSKDSRGETCKTSHWDTVHSGRPGCGKTSRDFEDSVRYFLEKKIPKCLRCHENLKKSLKEGVLL